MRWVVVFVLVVAALVMGTRRMNGISRAAAADTLGRRYAWLVHGWPVWRLFLAVAAVGVAVLVATWDGPARHGAAGRAAEPATRAATAPPVPAATRPPVPAADSGGWGLPVWLLLLLLAAVVVVAVCVAVGRSRTSQELAMFLATDGDDEDPPPSGWGPPRRDDGEYVTEDDPQGQAGTWPTERMDPAEDYDHEQAGGSIGSDGGHAGCSREYDQSGSGAVEDLVGGWAGASVHDLARRRRRAHRR